MKAWLLPLLLLSISACSDKQGEQALDNYSERMARVLQLELPEQPLPDVTPLVPERDLKQPLSDMRLDLTDAYATRQCGLDVLIGERNSSLGKVYSASKQLSYEIRFLALLQQCLGEHWDNDALLSELQTVYHEKQLAIQRAFDNMLLTDDTLRKELLGVRKSLDVQDAAGYTETLQALSALSQLQLYLTQQNWASASDINIEQQLQVLYHYNFTARLQYSLRRLAHQLSELNQSLQQISATQLCPTANQTEQLQILSNVFAKFFIKDVQRYSGNLTVYQQQLWPLLQGLYQHTPLQPMLAERFEISYQSMRAQLKQHVEWWQAMDKQCPLSLHSAVAAQR